MIFGRTDKENDDAEQRKWQAMCDNGINKFAWFPVKLYSGKKIWLGWYHMKYSMNPCWELPTRHATPHLNRVTAGKK